MKRMLVISDIHGEIYKFERLLEETSYDPAQDQLILLGDYVDRGPSPKAVIEKVMALKAQGAILLKGNHEDMMEKAFQDKQRLKHWFRNGGQETLKSYGYEVPEVHDLDQLVASSYPLKKTETLAKHLEFIHQLDHYYETEDFIFVHGGVHPTTPINETDPYLLMWIRDEFHHGYNGEKPVVFGHTPTDHFHDGFGVFFATNNIIGIDGGCVYGGQLNALELPSKKTYSVKDI
ncbi:serine/threonine protein phosphatase 1 [Pullulanibacillus pueri]|uniref:Serine/threonine protein phosphatase n=1 Tax=Pullulanibacillus pueri TaxID=1437324 RepID=A0A8J3ELG8_9BACL|nr:metallophosphoesterase family protein [Pullulanibacillus pueri]MBM7680813.1 serine/threonine protein phosphatase 1 [Pullulanibacillus pueri]GGH78435.1 serine/threonine protein phosphatase [Pullulanibacillus pueri]